MKTRIRQRAGVTLIEIMITIFIMSIAFLGLLMSRYNATVGARKADLYATAARTGLSFLESWRARGGIDTYNAKTEGVFPFAILTTGPAQPTDKDFANTDPTGYKVAIDGIQYFVTLSYYDFLPADPEFGLRALNVTVAWDARDDGDTAAVKDTNKLFTMTTYTNVPPPPAAP